MHVNLLRIQVPQNRQRVPHSSCKQNLYIYIYKYICIHTYTYIYIYKICIYIYTYIYQDQSTSFVWPSCCFHRRFRCFHAIATPVACFGTRPTAIRRRDLQRLDINSNCLFDSKVILDDQVQVRIFHGTRLALTYTYFLRERRTCTWATMCVRVRVCQH